MNNFTATREPLGIFCLELTSTTVLGSEQSMREVDSELEHIQRKDGKGSGNHIIIGVAGECVHFARENDRSG